ncbi:RibD family protein [Halofilum ochraceum]|uniref:RibD family protein n=1 Tax=Halofilum ochraceum TaxID=1611323 RepID=UPI0008DA2C48|nr:dihydrofolate reductase family protein [Halofilum ochraceum]
MSGVDAATAWSLVREALRVCPGQRRAITVCTGDASLEVAPGGAWSAAPSPDDAAAMMFDLYLPLCATPGESLVVAQMGQSLDGYVATADGDSCYVTGEADRAHLHCLRALVDAVIVGAGTVSADDPRLTVRAVEGEQPVRVVLARNGALDPAAHVLVDGAGPTLVVHAEDARPVKGDGLALATDAEGFFAPHTLLQALAARGLRRVLVEGGGRTVSRFLCAGALDRAHVTIAPLLIGAGRRGIDLPPATSIGHALRPPARRFLLGEDVLFDLDLRSG